jgi:hypothetical protein
MSLKLDLHVHSKSRGKVYIGPDELKDSLQKNGLDGVAITNFFNISHAVWLKEKIKEYLIIVGQEIWTTDGHIIGLGLKERIEDYQTAEETISRIHQQGGIAVAPHPYLHLGVRKKVMTLPIDAIESYNAYLGPSIIYNYLAARSARKRNIPQISSTDTTNAMFVGRSYTEVMVKDSELVLESIRSGKVKLRKRALPLPVIFIFKNLLNFKNVEPCSVHTVPCILCGKSMTVRIFREKFQCLDCGKIEYSHVVCCRGHYLCLECVMKRELSISKEQSITLY